MPLASAARRSRIRFVRAASRGCRGRVVAAPSPFTDSPLGYGWAYDDLDESYSAGDRRAVLQRGVQRDRRVRRRERRATRCARSTRPASTYPALIVRARTVARAAAGASAADSLAALPTITIGQDSSHAGVLVDGHDRRGRQRGAGARLPRLNARVRRGDARGASARRASSSTTRPTDTTAKLDSLAGMWSPTLREILPFFEKPSQNQIGEMLFKTLALAKTGVGTRRQRPRW